MVSVSSVNNNSYHVAMRSSSVQNPMVSENYYNIMEEPAKEKKQIGIVPIALGLLGAIGIGFGIYKHRQVAGLQDDLAKLTKDVKDKDGLLTPEKAEEKLDKFVVLLREHRAKKAAEERERGDEYSSPLFLWHKKGKFIMNLPLLFLQEFLVFQFCVF